MSTKKGLGRNFGSLLPSEDLSEAFDPTAGIEENVSELRQIAPSDIMADPSQPRRTFDKLALDDLTTSIKEHGVIQPLIVIPHHDTYMLVAGERRWRAAQKAGLKKVPALVRTLSDQHKLELALIENVQREDLNPLETAQAYMKLRDEFNLSLADISQRVGGKSVTVISNFIRLLGLPEQAKKAIVEKKITEGHARQVLALDGDNRAQSTLLQHIIKDGWSVRQAERFVIGYKKGSGRREQHAVATRATRSETPFTKKLSKKLQTRVSIKTTAHGGQLLISFKDDSDLHNILTRF